MPRQQRCAGFENKDPRPFTGTMLPHYKERSLVLFEGQVGRLGGLTRQGCTFHPEELGTLSRYRAERYIPLRDTYQLLYRLEMQNEIEYKGLRRRSSTDVTRTSRLCWAI